MTRSIKKRTYRLSVQKLDQLLCEKGITLEDLAAKCGIDLRTLQRKRQGQPAFPDTIHCIADALGRTFSELVDEPTDALPVAQDKKPSCFQLHLTLSGAFHSIQQKDYLIKLNSRVISLLEKEGIRITEQAFNAATSHIAGSGSFRLVLAVRAVTDGRPSWFLATVRPSMLPALEKAEVIDVREFPFGEVIQSGWGQEIPDSAINQVVVLLDCKPWQILETGHP